MNALLQLILLLFKYEQNTMSYEDLESLDAKIWRLRGLHALIANIRHKQMCNVSILESSRWTYFWDNLLFIYESEFHIYNKIKETKKNSDEIVEKCLDLAIYDMNCSIIRNQLQPVILNY